MKFLTLADLHLDFYFGQQMYPFAKIPDGQLDGVAHCVLAGDLSNKGQINASPAYLGSRNAFPARKSSSFPAIEATKMVPSIARTSCAKLLPIMVPRLSRNLN